MASREINFEEVSQLKKDTEALRNNVSRLNTLVAIRRKFIISNDASKKLEKKLTQELEAFREVESQLEQVRRQIDNDRIPERYKGSARRVEELVSLKVKQLQDDRTDLDVIVES